FAPSVNGEVLDVSFQPDAKIIVSGNYYSVNNEKRAGICRLKPNGTVDQTFMASTNFRVASTFVTTTGNILAGGDFEMANGVPRNSVVQFLKDGTVDASFDPLLGSPGRVLAMYAYPNGQILVGGDFNSVGSVRRNRLARINADGTVDEAFSIGGADGDILVIAKQNDGRILVGGEFNHFAASNSKYLVRLNDNGTMDETFNVPVNGRIRDINVLPNGQILIGGN